MADIVKDKEALLRIKSLPYKPLDRTNKSEKEDKNAGENIGSCR